MKIFDFLKDKFDLEVRNKNLYYEAFTHSSYINECKQNINCYERLEFLGDAVVEIWVSKKLFHHRPKISEGKMTTMRAQLVCEKSLANFARKINLNDDIRLGVGEEKNGGRNRDSLICDVFEAFIGALYLDLGRKAVDTVLDYVIDIVDNPELTGIVDYKTKLQELIQTDSRRTLKYVLFSEEGTANDPMFEFGVYLDDVLLGTGKEHTKKKAEQLAAKEALDKLVL